MKRLTGFGVGIPPQLVWREGTWIVEQEFDLLGPRPFLNWGPSPIGERDGWTFAPMVYSAAEYSASAVSQRMSANDGETWLLLNEPERPEQANTQAGAAANMTRNFLQTAWATGREFQWAAPGVWIGTNSYDGLAWATAYMQDLRRRGVPSSTYIHVHGYRSTTLSQFNAGWALTAGLCGSPVRSKIGSCGAAGCGMTRARC